MATEIELQDVEEMKGVYNNDFENVCMNLILVSAFRGVDIQKDTLQFNNYLKEKNIVYQAVNNDGLDGIKQKLQDLKSIVEERIRLEDELFKELFKKLNEKMKK